MVTIYIPCIHWLQGDHNAYKAYKDYNMFCIHN